MPSPRWKSAEELVAAIEKSLAPDAVVEHNVFLPVMGQDRSRQCDVVLRVGKPPREQLFIVEVQQRGAKPDINTFGGWLRKMDEVGANGLICVSEVGFPQSIIDDVALRVGPKVKLMTLDRDEAELSLGSFYLIPELVRSTYKIRNIEVKGAELWESNSDRSLTFELSGRILSNTGNPDDAQTLVSIATQCACEKDPHAHLPQSAVGQPIQVNYDLVTSDSLQLWLHANEGVFRLRRWTISMTIQRFDKSEPMIYSKWNYSQKFHGSTVAWVATASFDITEGTVKMTLVFTTDKSGFLRPSLTLEVLPQEIAQPSES